MLLVSALLLMLGTTEHVTVDERHAPDFWRRTIIIPAGEFNDARVSALAREFSRDAAGYKTAVLSIFVDRTDARIMSGKGSLPVTYESWWKEYSLYGGRQLPMAQVVAFGTGAVLRVSDGQKESRRIVLRGADPLLLNSSAVAAEVVDLCAYRGIPLGSAEVRERNGAEVFVKTSMPLDDFTAQSVSRLAAEKVGLEFAYVFIRNDIWFIDQAFFPVDYRFEETPPPTYDQYQGSTTFDCYVESAQAKCWPRKPIHPRSE